MRWVCRVNSGEPVVAAAVRLCRSLAQAGKGVGRAGTCSGARRPAASAPAAVRPARSAPQARPRPRPALMPPPAAAAPARRTRLAPPAGVCSDVALVSCHWKQLPRRPAGTGLSSQRRVVAGPVRPLPRGMPRRMGWQQSLRAPERGMRQRRHRPTPKGAAIPSLGAPAATGRAPRPPPRRSQPGARSAPARGAAAPGAPPPGPGAAGFAQGAQAWVRGGAGHGGGAAHETSGALLQDARRRRLYSTT
jgi:hypothetical protein